MFSYLYLLLIFISAHSSIFRFGAKIIPHPDKIQKGGEDAYFADSQIIAVADGVGSWADHGVDPGLYSKELCSNIQYLFQNNQNQYIHNPRQLIIDAESKTKAQGTSTITIITLSQQNNQLYISQLGDSGYLLLRLFKDNFKIVKIFKDHQHQFNMPYQIGTQGDDPSEALQDIVEVKDNDLLIVASDGLFDNMDAKQIIVFIQQKMRGQALQDMNLQKLSNLLAQKAFSLSLDSEYKSPFMKKAKKQGLKYKGGKEDDITVVIALIQVTKEQLKSDL